MISKALFLYKVFKDITNNQNCKRISDHVLDRSIKYPKLKEKFWSCPSCCNTYFNAGAGSFVAVKLTFFRDIADPKNYNSYVEHIRISEFSIKLHKSGYLMLFDTCQ